MYKRLMENEVLEASKGYPIITLLGPRQSGKTTLVRKVFPEKKYYNLEALDTRELALQDPRKFLDNLKEGAILDEIQNAPELLSYIQVYVDEANKNGLFILTGSHQLQLHQAISQSLAGRTAIFTLLPMSIEELLHAGFNFSLDQYLLNGGYPRIHKEGLNPTQTYRSYYQSYIERDLRQLINLKDLSQFQNFLKICVGRVGQLLNYESLANDTGVSGATIKNWISILEASFVLFRLVPFYENFGKRHIKSPKIYFTDVGFASYLLGIEDEKQMQRDPLRGHLVENLVIVELMKMRLNKGLDPNLYFFRDTAGNEVDLLVQKGRQLIAVEIKASQTYNSSLLKNLKYFLKLAKEKVLSSYLVYAGDAEQKVGDIDLINYLNCSNIYKDC